MTAASPRHHLSDWLALHQLSPDACRSILDAMPKRAASLVLREGSAGPCRFAIDLETAWGTTHEAMRKMFPAQKDLIGLTFENTIRIQGPRRQKSRRAATIDNGPDAYPTILYSFSAETADLLVLAHEFAHALQIRASGGHFVSPIMREVCAFVGEHALMAHISSFDTTLHNCLGLVRDAKNQRSFDIERRRLLAALSGPEPTYSYSWNYPIARYLAMELSERLKAGEIWALFQGLKTVTGLLLDLDLVTA